MTTNPSGTPTIAWFEKSVEYQFIAEMVTRKKFVWAAPLDGDAESALGDTVVNWDGKLLLIEFKKDADTLTSEYKKYSLLKDATERERAFTDAKAVMRL